MKYNIIFGTILILTIGAWISAFWLAEQPALNDHQVDLLSKTTDMWQLGIGVIFGLLTERLSSDA
jgi:hypothetical protein